MSDDRWKDGRGAPKERSAGNGPVGKTAWKPHKPDRPRKADPRIVETELARIRRLLGAQR